MTILPFLGSNRKKRKVMAQEVKEFSELVKDQYTFLMQQLEKVLKDYFDLSSKVKEMHTEIFSLRVSWHRLLPYNVLIRSVHNVVQQRHDNDSIDANYGTCAIYRTYSIYLIHS